MMLDPILMLPAFRYGAMTPWGGRGLEKIGKVIPDERTGESLEVSVLPGLESRTVQGETLTELLQRYGTALRGEKVSETFPLLLKFISSEESLSVQVHPDDAYAGKYENGKLGKTEAWVILDCCEGAQIVFGTAPGMTREKLTEACAKGGETLRSSLRFVDVKPGDVYFIPAGMLHAIGAGITLMEIQQSSDVTYRFYDWDRVDKNGKPRELHIKKGLDVTALDLCSEATRADEKDGVASYIREKAFSLEKWFVRGEKQLSATPEAFRILCPMQPMRLEWADGALDLKLGDSVLLPAMMKDAVLKGEGEAWVMSPGAEA